MQDFISYTISGIMSLFAALIGVAYPLILQSAQRIDDKYQSTILTLYVVNKPSFRLFRLLMASAIPIAIISPFIIYYYQDNEVYCYLMLCLQSVLTCAQLLNFYYINYVIQKVTIPPQFLDMLITENEDNQRINEIFAFSQLHVIETTPELLQKAVNIVYSYLRGSDDSIVNSSEYNQILNSIVKLLEESDSKRQTIYCKSSDLWDVLLSPKTKFAEEMRYTWLWKFLQSSIIAGNKDHILRYWSWADQYAPRLNVAQMESKDNSKEQISTFKHFNTMVCAALIYSNNWKLLNDLLYYSHVYPPKYDLMLNTFSDVIEEVHFICSRDMSWLLKYIMYGMKGGVTSDFEIRKQVMRYLALSYLRLQSVNNYNITYSNPMSLPNINDNISDCQIQLQNAELLLRNVQEWQVNKDIINMCLIPGYDYTENTNSLLLNYIEQLQAKIDSIKKHPNVSNDKLQRFINELKATIQQDKLYLPELNEKSSDLVLVYDKTRYEKIFPVKKTYLADGGDWLYFLPENMVKQINNDVRWTYYSQCFLLKAPQKSYSIGYNQLIKALERLGVDSEYEVWVSGFLISRYIDIDGVDALKLKGMENNTWNLNGCEIHEFECKMNVAVIVEKGNMPRIYAKDFKLLTERNMKELDSNTHFYSNIENKEYNEYDENHHEINLGRIVEFYAPENYQYILLNLTYPETEPSAIDEIVSIKNK